MPGPVSRARLLVTIAVVSAAVSACGQGFDRQSAIESFQAANPEVNAEQAGCVVDGMIERYGLDGLADELEAGPGASDAFTDAQFHEMFACGVEGDVATQLTDQLRANGVAAEDAPCVADTLAADLEDADIDVLLSGDITDDFMAKFVAAMEACDALTPEG